MGNLSLDAAGLVALADLTTIAKRTALTGTACLSDVLVLCPGIHRQQNAPDLNGGEYPATGAMTTGYVFRVENPATVLYLQKVGVTGHLTTVSVSKPQGGQGNQLLSLLYHFHGSSLVSSIAYLVAVSMTILALTSLGLSQDWWGLAVILILMLSRFCNVLVVRRRVRADWKGASEPGVKGDLLVLLSQDRWVRMRGFVDDLKAVTSGQWLRDMDFLESSVSATSTVLVYLDAALASNVGQTGKLILLALLIGSIGLLAIANDRTDVLQMKGCVLRVEGKPKAYARRLDLANELVEESGRDDWAVSLGMIVADKPNLDSRAKVPVAVTM